MTLRCKIEIVPFGDEDKAYEIGRFDIFNKGHIDLGHCTYGVIEIEPELKQAGLYTEEIYHRRDLGAWELVHKVLSRLKLKKEAQQGI